MSTTTENYGLVKPELTDVADITAMNENWDKVDTKLKYIDDEVAKTLPVSKGGTGATSTSDARKNLSVNEKTFIYLSQIGLTEGSETIESIVDSLPTYSSLITNIGANNAKIYPDNYGLLRVTKIDETRTIFEFFQKSNGAMYVGCYDSSLNTPWTNWNVIYSSGHKPSPSDIGAASSQHSHDYLPLTGGVLTGSLVVIDNFNVNKTYDTVEYKTYVKPINYSVAGNGDYSTGIIHYKDGVNDSQLLFNKDGIIFRDNVNAKAYKIYGQHNVAELRSNSLNRTTAVNAADTNYTTLMARGTSLHTADTNPSVNGAICWTYK